MGKSSKPTITSGLTNDQQDILSIFRDFLVNKDRNGPGKGMGYGKLDDSGTPYKNQMVADMPPGWKTIKNTVLGTSPFASNRPANEAIAPLLAGQTSMPMQNLQPPSQLNLGNLSAPTFQRPGTLTMGNLNNPTFANIPTLSLGDLNPAALKSQSSGYGYSPTNVKSSMDVKGFTQDYFNKGVMAPLLREYDQSIAPRIEDSAAAAGNTFSTRTQLAREKALEGLQNTATGELSRVVREDELTRSQQNLESQMFNSQQGLQNAQFGAGLGLNYAQMNSQNALGLGQLNTQRALGAGQLNSQNQLGINAQNLQSALGFGQLNTDRSLGAFNANTAAQQNYNSLASQNALGFGQLNTQRSLDSFKANSANKLGYDTLNTNTNMMLGENAMNRRQSAAALSAQLAGLPLQQAGMMANLLNPLQQNEQAKLDAAYNEFMRQAPENSPYLRLALGMAGVDPNAVATPQRNPFGSTMGGAMMGQQLAGPGMAWLGQMAGLGGGGQGLLGNLGGAGLGLLLGLL